jgi:CotH kinase protein
LRRWRRHHCHHFDEASAVNFYIVNELMGNVDGAAFYSSDYLYKAKNNPLLYMGPVWDFDISSGNSGNEPIANPTVPWMQTQGV